MTHSIARLLYSNDQNWLYATNMQISDPRLWYIDTKGQTHLVLSSIEIVEAQKKATADTLHTFPSTNELTGTGPFAIRLLLWLQKRIDDKPQILEIPNNCPAEILFTLQEMKINVHITESAFFKERTIKTKEEIEALRTAQQNNEKGFHRIVEVLKQSNVANDNSIIWNEKPLTSEILRAEMCKAQLDAGCTSFNHGPIVSGGPQSAMPHEIGHGPLMANSFIVVDSFPTASNHYCGDLTRTFIKGSADNWHKDIYNAVLAAQHRAFSILKDGVNGKDVHQQVIACFEKHGFESGIDKSGSPYGFFHGTGHGIGLEVHDLSDLVNISTRDCYLKTNHVTSVEPGLYYPNKGGCRIEDIVAITKNGYDNLTVFPTDNWVIE